MDAIFSMTGGLLQIIWVAGRSVIVKDSDPTKCYAELKFHKKLENKYFKTII